MLHVVKLGTKLHAEGQNLQASNSRSHGPGKHTLPSETLQAFESDLADLPAVLNRRNDSKIHEPASISWLDSLTSELNSEVGSCVQGLAFDIFETLSKTRS